MTQTPLRELLRSDMYKAWLLKAPPASQVRGDKPWRVFVQRTEGGPWAKADFPTYKAALRYVARNLKVHHDMALSCRSTCFDPPSKLVSKGGRMVRLWWRIPPGHRWCGYCRRPTVFRSFSKHHAIPIAALTSERRCTVCGCREGFLPRRGKG